MKPQPGSGSLPGNGGGFGRSSSVPLKPTQQSSLKRRPRAALATYNDAPKTQLLSRVVYGLYVGISDCASRPDILGLYRISLVVLFSSPGMAPPPASRFIKVHSINVPDTPAAVLLRFSDVRQQQLLSDIVASINAHQGVLLASTNGQSRSVVFAAAVLVRLYQWTAEASLSVVVSRRPSALPRREFVGQLGMWAREYETDLVKSATFGGVNTETNIHLLDPFSRHLVFEDKSQVKRTREIGGESDDRSLSSANVSTCDGSQHGARQSNQNPNDVPTSPSSPPNSSTSSLPMVPTHSIMSLNNQMKIRPIQPIDILMRNTMFNNRGLIGIGEKFALQAAIPDVVVRLMDIGCLTLSTSVLNKKEFHKSLMKPRHVHWIDKEDQKGAQDEDHLSVASAGLTKRSLSTTAGAPPKSSSGLNRPPKKSGPPISLFRGATPGYTVQGKMVGGQGDDSNTLNSPMYNLKYPLNSARRGSNPKTHEPQVVESGLSKPKTIKSTEESLSIENLRFHICEQYKINTQALHEGDNQQQGGAQGGNGSVSLSKKRYVYYPVSILMNIPQNGTCCKRNDLLMKSESGTTSVNPSTPSTPTRCVYPQCSVYVRTSTITKLINDKTKYSMRHSNTQDNIGANTNNVIATVAANDTKVRNRGSERSESGQGTRRMVNPDREGRHLVPIDTPPSMVVASPPYGTPNQQQTGRKSFSDEKRNQNPPQFFSNNSAKQIDVFGTNIPRLEIITGPERYTTFADSNRGTSSTNSLNSLNSLNSTPTSGRNTTDESGSTNTRRQNPLLRSIEESISPKQHNNQTGNHGFKDDNQRTSQGDSSTTPPSPSQQLHTVSDTQTSHNTKKSSGKQDTPLSEQNPTVPDPLELLRRTASTGSSRGNRQLRGELVPSPPPITQYADVTQQQQQHQQAGRQSTYNNINMVPQPSGTSSARGMGVMVVGSSYNTSSNRSEGTSGTDQRQTGYTNKATGIGNTNATKNPSGNQYSYVYQLNIRKDKVPQQRSNLYNSVMHNKTARSSSAKQEQNKGSNFLIDLSARPNSNGLRHIEGDLPVGSVPLGAATRETRGSDVGDYGNIGDSQGRQGVGQESNQQGANQPLVQKMPLSSKERGINTKALTLKPSFSYEFNINRHSNSPNGTNTNTNNSGDTKVELGEVGVGVNNGSLGFLGNTPGRLVVASKTNKLVSLDSRDTNNRQLSVANQLYYIDGHGLQNAYNNNNNINNNNNGGNLANAMNTPTTNFNSQPSTSLMPNQIALGVGGIGGLSIINNNNNNSGLNATTKRILPPI